MKYALFASMWGLAGLLVVNGAWGQEEKPWALRDHYEVRYGPTAFTYDVNTSEWQIEVDGAGPIFKNVESEVVLGDGQVVRLRDQKLDHDERQPFQDSFGKGTFFRSVYKPDSGISMRYSLKQFSDRAFMQLQIQVRNDGTEPITIAAIRPAVMIPGSIANAAQQADVKALHVAQRGGVPMLDDTADATLIRLRLSSPNIAIGLGVLPSGGSNPSVTLDRSGPSWSGSAGVTFSPPLVLRPGESVGADPLWLAFVQGESSYIQSSYAWCRSVMPSTRRTLAAPPTWVTVAEGDPVERLYDAARAWRKYDIRGAVVPGSWEREPGTLRPKMPQYPSDMREVVQTLKSIGVKPGVAYDPLAAGNSKKGTILTAKDGSRWFAPSNREAVTAAANHARELTNMGFAFYVVQPSRIPDDVLEEAGITRNEADLFAFGVMNQAAGPNPVLPSAAMSLADEVSRWKQAANTTAGYASYGLVAGPIQLNAQRLTVVTPDLLTSINQFAGPIEILGIPNNRLQRELGPTLADAAWRQQLEAFMRPKVRINGGD